MPQSQRSPAFHSPALVSLRSLLNAVFFFYSFARVSGGAWPRAEMDAGLLLLSTKDDFVNLLDFLDAKTIFTNVVSLGTTLRDAPVAARGGQCILRKSLSPIQLPLVDYARHVSHREQLSRAVGLRIGEDSEGEVASFEGNRPPHQHHPHRSPHVHTSHPPISLQPLSMLLAHPLLFPRPSRPAPTPPALPARTPHPNAHMNL